MKSPIRILLIGPYSPPRGGVQAHITALREYLRSRDISCQVIDLSPGRKTDGIGVYGPRNALDVARLLLTLDYDIAHLHVGGNISTRIAALAILASLIPRRKSILTFHSGGYPSSPEGRAMNRHSFRGIAVNCFDRVVGVNEEIVEWFHRVGVSQERIRLISPHAVPGPPPTVDLPESLKTFMAIHSPLLVSVGGLEPEYDLPLQIEALGELRVEFPQAGLVLVGSGSLEQDLRSRATQKAYNEHIYFCGDIERSVALRVIAESDLMLRTTLYDGDSIAVREAVHFGVPVVATDRAPRPEGVRIVPAQNLELLRSSVTECLRNGKRRQPSNEPEEENCAALVALYEEVIAEG
jgi:glycosyltransferase involved in cell wall biosynthesis